MSHTHTHTHTHTHSRQAASPPTHLGAAFCFFIFLHTTVARPIITHSHTHTHTLILSHKHTGTRPSSASHQLPQAHTYLFSHSPTLMLTVTHRHTFTRNQTHTDTQSWLCTQQVDTCTYVHLNSITSGHCPGQKVTQLQSFTLSHTPVHMCAYTHTHTRALSHCHLHIHSPMICTPSQCPYPPWTPRLLS